MNAPRICKAIAQVPLAKQPPVLLPAAAAQALQPGGLAPELVADPNNDMVKNQGRTIANLVYTNFFLGLWDAGDRQNIDSALHAVMVDPGMNAILGQYFPGETVSATFHPSALLPAPSSHTMNKTAVESLVSQLHAQGHFDGADFPDTIFNFMLPRGTFLTDLTSSAAQQGAEAANLEPSGVAPLHVGFGQEDTSDSRNGLGGYHGSVHVKAQDGSDRIVYYAVGVFSETVNGVPNGIPVFADSWKNVVATFYHELCEARTDPDVEDGNRGNPRLFGWGNRTFGEIGDIPIDVASDITLVIKEIQLADGQIAPVQLMYSNRVHGPEQPSFPPGQGNAANGLGQALPATSQELAAFSAAAFAGSCTANTLKPYTKIAVPPVDVTGRFIAYATPDSTYFVTKERFEAATISIGIGTYDFTASYVADLLLAARQKPTPVSISLMVDLDPPVNQNADQQIFDTLKAAGCTCVISPSHRFKAPVHYFCNAHEKYMVLDGEWVMVQSGNYSTASIPKNEGDGTAAPGFMPGNRDMGVAVESPELNAFFRKLLASDMKLELDAEAMGLPQTPVPQEILPTLVVAPAARPPQLFPSQTFTPNGPITVQPVLTPDNYVEVVLPFLKTARRSLFLEQQYIHAGEAQISVFCSAIQQLRANNPALDVRIILAPPFHGEASSRKTLQRDIDALQGFGLRLGQEVKLLNPAHFLHCHNKLIIVDDAAVLIGSQNWSDTAVLLNREASLLIPYPDLAAYYSRIFQADWNDGLKAIPAPPAAPLAMPVGVAAPPVGATVLRPGDYREV